MRLLYLQNEDQTFWPQTVTQLFLDSHFEVDIFKAYENEFPEKLDAYHCIFLSGSVLSAYDQEEWIIKEEQLIRQAAEMGIPMLGACFGSQILASALCGQDQVFRRSSCALGYTDISLNHSEPDDPLLQGLGPSVRMFVWHNIQVKSGHPDMHILGYNNDCSNHIWRYKNLPIWGIQGHPELDPTSAQAMFLRYHRFFEKEGVSIAELARTVEPNTEAVKLFTNFMDYCHTL
jgi:GMP synthase (glutamine-hydrolysing)